MRLKLCIGCRHRDAQDAILRTFTTATFHKRRAPPSCPRYELDSEPAALRPLSAPRSSAAGACLSPIATVVDAFSVVGLNQVKLSLSAHELDPHPETCFENQAHTLSAYELLSTVRRKRR
jgi:hypothetical protein